MGVGQQCRAEQDVRQARLLLRLRGVEADGVVAGRVDSAGVRGDDRRAVGEPHVDDDIARIRGDADVLRVPEARLQVHGMQAEPQPGVQGVTIGACGCRAVQLLQRAGEMTGRRRGRAGRLSAAEEPDTWLTERRSGCVDQVEQRRDAEIGVGQHVQELLHALGLHGDVDGDLSRLGASPGAVGAQLLRRRRRSTCVEVGEPGLEPRRWCGAGPPGGCARAHTIDDLAGLRGRAARRRCAVRGPGRRRRRGRRRRGRGRRVVLGLDAEDGDESRQVVEALGDRPDLPVAVAAVYLGGDHASLGGQSGEGMSDGRIGGDRDVPGAVIGDRAGNAVVQRGRDDDRVDRRRNLVEVDLDLDGREAAGAAATGTFLVEEDEVLVRAGSALIVDEKSADVDLAGRQVRAQGRSDERADDRCVPALG